MSEKQKQDIVIKIAFCIFWILLLPIAILEAVYKILINSVKTTGEMFNYYIEMVSKWWEEKLDRFN